ncbi:DNA circularization protein [Yersinia massiliensis]|uniref:DNA circularization protein n=1 Tax=Yersinia massiliensis TaxID=419257 RepID=UPI0028CFEEA9|nr:DNA circularization N-terminal domain-containing protein [Yersinia massiliensis]
MDMTALFSDTSWRGRLAEGKGTFRGVPFWMIEDATLTGGRRIVRHEYPLRDDGQTEDMGRALRQYAFTAVVLGDDYFDQRDALIEALEANGVAELVHPNWGTLNVQIETYTVRESCGALGTAIFSITFSPAADDTAPIETEDTQLNSDSLADSLLSDVQTAWATATEKMADATAAMNEVEKTVNTLTNGVRGLTSSSGGASLLAAALALKGSITHLINTPGQLFGDMFDLIKGISETGASAVSSRALKKTLVGVQTQFTSNEPAVAHIQQIMNTAVTTYIAAELAEVTLAAAKEGAQVTPGTPALTGGNNGVSLVSPEIQAETEAAAIETLEDCNQAVSELGDVLLDALINTGDMGWFQSSSQVRTYRLTFIQHMMATAQNLPTARAVQLTGTEPALVTLYRHTGDVLHLDRFIRRNGIRHPAFVTGGVDVEIINDTSH